MDANTLWEQKYARLWAEERAREEARREQAFLDLPHIVCGEPLRSLAAIDWVVLNGIKSPFVCGGQPTAGDIGVMLWWLHEDNDRTETRANLKRRAAMLRRIAGLPFVASVAEINDYIDEAFLDAPPASGSSDRRPLGTCFIAPMVLRIASETGWGEHEILATPLARLFQYSKVMTAKNAGKDFVDFAPSDRLMGEMLTELNEINNARN